MFYGKLGIRTKFFSIGGKWKKIYAKKWDFFWHFFKLLQNVFFGVKYLKCEK